MIGSAVASLLVLFVLLARLVFSAVLKDEWFVNSLREWIAFALPFNEIMPRSAAHNYLKWPGLETWFESVTKV